MSTPKKNYATTKGFEIGNFRIGIVDILIAVSIVVLIAIVLM